jgi:hypothetical protein
MSDQPPPTTLEPPPLPPPRPPNDTVLRGFAMGCGTSIAFAVLGVIAALTIDSAGNGKLSDYLFAGWGVTQWIGILPLIANEQSKGRKKSIKGLIIAGCIGLLLSSACAGILLNLNIR